MKIWADRYYCSAEVKGASLPLAHDTFIVTSNYSIEELFKDTPKMIEPLKRRFTEVLFDKMIGGYIDHVGMMERNYNVFPEDMTRILALHCPPLR